MSFNIIVTMGFISTYEIAVAAFALRRAINSAHAEIAKKAGVDAERFEDFITEVLMSPLPLSEAQMGERWGLKRTVAMDRLFQRVCYFSNVPLIWKSSRARRRKTIDMPFAQYQYMME